MEGDDKIPTASPQASPSTSTLSKNQLKKRRRDEKWEAGREARKEKRKAKTKAKKAEIRAARDQSRLSRSVLADGEIVSKGPTKSSKSGSKIANAIRLPVSFVIDCSFDNLMMNHEQKSLSSQITRSYSQNQKSSKKAHLVISSFTGSLKERFDGLLAGQYRSWKGVRFLEEEFDVAAAQAKDWMQEDLENMSAEKRQTLHDFLKEDSKARVDNEIVYLSSDSDETLTELQPNGVYIIGGLVDKNRHKGVCFRKAMDAGVRTAKLPIAEYMKMNSRSVLTVNHVVEILLRWLECRDWGRAFLDVMPSRKGGTLRSEARSPSIEASSEKESQTVEAEDEAQTASHPKETNPHTEDMIGHDLLNQVYPQESRVE